LYDRFKLLLRFEPHNNLTTKSQLVTERLFAPPANVIKVTQHRKQTPATSQIQVRL